MKIKEREREGKEARIVKRAGLAPPPFPPSPIPPFFLSPFSQRCRGGREKRRTRAEPTEARLNYANPLFPLDFSSSRQMRAAHKPVLSLSLSLSVAHSLALSLLCTCFNVHTRDYIRGPYVPYPLTRIHLYVYVSI